MIRFLFKGLLRDRSRCLFPLLTVATGVFLTVVFFAWIQGIVGNMMDTSARLDTGHVKIMTQAYAGQADQLPNDLAVLGVSGLLSKVRAEYPALTWTPRIRFGGLLDVPDERGETRTQGPVLGLGVDLLGRQSPEPDLLRLTSALIRGALPRKAGEILVSDEFARHLGLEPGGKVTLISSTMYGSMATANFTLAGTIRLGTAALDRGTMIADFGDIQDVLDMSDAAGEVLGFFANGFYDQKRAEALTAEFNRRYEKAGNDYYPVMNTLKSLSGMGGMFDLMGIVIKLMIGVFLFAMSLVLWNAGLMGSIRRYGEIGVRLAMGESKGHIFRSLIGESLIIGAVGSAAGTVLGLAAAFYLQAKGVDTSSLFKNSSVLMTAVVRARVVPLNFVIGFVPGLLATFLGTALAGRTIYKRQTSRLIKEMEA